jgi:phosphoribosylformimino-5-aminoimidazole carboxamide ribotide isomerase
VILIPAIDLKDGHCVRLLRGDFAAQTRYGDDPHDLLARYRGFGAEWLHVVDLDGASRDSASQEVPTNRGIIARLAAQSDVKLQVGGGLRDTAALNAAFDVGVARVVVGSAAVTHVQRVRGWLDEFGPDRVVLAFDVRLDHAGIPCVAIHGWLEQSTLTLWDAVEHFAGSGLKHVLCTDVGRDGALTGPNVELYAIAVRRFPTIEWQASGGVRDARDLHALADAGCGAAISGKALLDHLIPLEELRPFLRNA